LKNLFVSFFIICYYLFGIGVDIAEIKGMKTRDIQPKQTREFSPRFILDKEKKTMKPKKATPKKATPKKARKPQAKKSIFSSVKNLAYSGIVSLIRSESAKQNRIIDIVELADKLTDLGYPITPEKVRKDMQKWRRQFYSNKEEAESMKGNGQVQISDDEILGWRKVGTNPIAYGIEKGKLS